MPYLSNFFSFQKRNKNHQVSHWIFGFVDPGPCRTSYKHIQKTKKWTGVGIKVNVGPLWNDRGAINRRCLSLLLGSSRASPVKLHGSLISIWCTTMLVMSVHSTQVNIFGWIFVWTVCSFIRIIWNGFWLICSFIFEMILWKWKINCGKNFEWIKYLTMKISKIFNL